MEQTFHYSAVHRIHHTSDRRERMASLRHVYQYLHAVIERSELKLQRCNFAGSKKQRDQRPK